MNLKTTILRGTLLAAAALAGCGMLPDKPARTALYDFGPSPAPVPAAVAAMPRLAPIQLADVDAHARLDGTQILYRLSYSDGNELRPYSQARWSVAPTQLLEQRLREALAQRRVVLGEEEGTNIARVEGRMPNGLRLTLEEFCQVFESPGTSYGLVRVRATLMNATSGGNRVLGQRTFTAQQPAASADAPGGVKALAGASDAVVLQIVQWADQMQQAQPQ